ncbi:hypothetical protein ACOMHN_049946 [Nucella lapillus]
MTHITVLLLCTPHHYSSDGRNDRHSKLSTEPEQERNNTEQERNNTEQEWNNTEQERNNTEQERNNTEQERNRNGTTRNRNGTTRNSSLFLAVCFCLYRELALMQRHLLREMERLPRTQNVRGLWHEIYCTLYSIT